MERAIALLGAHSWEKEFAIKTAMRMGLRIVLIADFEDTANQVLRFADKTIIANPYNSEQVISGLMSYARNHRIAGIVGLNDFVLRTAAEAARALGLKAFSDAAIQCANDKYLFRQRLLGRSYSVPCFCLVENDRRLEEVLSNIPFPVMLKPRDLGASVAVHEVKSSEELRKVWAQAKHEVNDFRLPFHKGEFLLETFVQRKPLKGLPNGEFSVEVVSFAGRHYPVAFTDKRVLSDELPVEVGQLVPAAFAQRDPAMRRQLSEVVCSVLNDCQIDWGITHNEVILSDNGPKVVEIHLRPAGDRIIDLVYHAMHVNLYEILFNLAMGEPLDETWLKPKINRAAMIQFFDFARRTDAEVMDLRYLHDASIDEDVIDLKFQTKEHVLNPVNSYFQRYGYVMCGGRLPEDAEANVKRVVRAVENVVTSKVRP